MGILHPSRDIPVEAFFFRRQRFTWSFQVLSDDRKLFRVGQTLRVVGCGVIDLVAAGDPSRVSMLPKGFDELVDPREVLVVRRSFRVEVLENHPVAREDSS